MPAPERPEIDPSIDITFPSSGAVLTASRDGNVEVVTMQVKDFTPSSVAVRVTQGTEVYTVAATKSPTNAKQWSAQVRFRHSGSARIVGVATRLAGPQTATLESDPPLDVSIAPNQRLPITVTLDNAQDGDPAAPANGARIKILAGGGALTIAASIASATRRIEYQTSIDNYTTTQVLHSANGQWSADLSIAGDHAPSGPVLIVRDIDHFGNARETNYSFWLIDSTAPQIEVSQPTEDQELYLPVGQRRLDVTVIGRVDDAGQSGYHTGTLTYTFNGQATHIEPDASGRFEFTLPSAALGPNRFAVTATDIAGNQTPEVTREFIVASNYRPKTISELLSQRSYLADLIRFANSHVLDRNGQAISSEVLSQTFMPLNVTAADDFFGAVSEPGALLGERTVNELLPAVSLLRTQARGLMLHLPFDFERGQETPDKGPLGLYASLTRPGMIGQLGTATAGALVVDGNAHANVGGGAALSLSELGKENADFSVSFWIYPGIGHNGNWRAVMYKGHEDAALSVATSNRTFGIWLHPDSNQLHYRIGTINNPNEGGESVQEVALNRWTHVAYVKKGAELQLFLNGVKDSSTSLSGAVVANSDDLHIGKSPYQEGFAGALDEVRIFGFALSKQDVSYLAQDRAQPANNQGPLNAYVHSAYEALLIAHGTSYEEIRTLPAAGSAARRTIAQRLGLTVANASDDALVILQLPNLSDSDLESWLQGTFDLPSTKDLLASDDNNHWRGTLLTARQDYLARRWLAEDTLPVVAIRPMLDPDLVDPQDLDADHLQSHQLLSQRSAQLDAQWMSLRNAADANAALGLVYAADDIVMLAKIEDKERSGQAIVDMLPPMGLSMSGFRRVRYYQQIQQPLSDREKEDLAQLLTQVKKLRTFHPVWVGEERGMTVPMWPTSRAAGAFVTGNFKRDFLPWRGAAAERIWWEKLVSSRLSTFDAMSEAHERAVLDAQRVALPLFRDRLLSVSNLPSAGDVMDDVTERLLADVASAGVLTRSLIAHATLMLQRLVNGIRLGRYAAGHPAASWTLRTTWLVAPTNDAALVFFDEEWRWMGTYGSWRSAKSHYLYPVNALYPDLRTASSAPFSMSSPFQNVFLKELRKLAPAAPPDAWITANTTGVANYERDFFVPVAVGVMLERSSQYAQALDWYRKVYESKNPSASRAKAQPLIDEQNKNKAPHIQYDDRWTLQSDPHTNASRSDPVSRQQIRRFGNPYTRFILARICRCLIGEADAEFAMGSDESRTEALDLYLEVKQILAFDELTDLPPADASEAYLPNPVFAAMRDHVSAALRKLRRGLTYLGTPVMADLMRASDGMSLLSRPTPYRFRVLVERSKQMVALSQNLEAQYLSALEKRDAEAEKFRRDAGNAQIADASVSLRFLQQAEAIDGVSYAQAQKSRTQIQKDRYADWIAAGPNQFETQQVSSLWSAKTASDVVAGFDAAVTTANATPGDWSESLSPASWARLGTIAGLSVGKAIAQGFANYDQALAQVSGIRASQERRREEWQLQSDLSQQDLLIADQQIGLANDRVAIANMEYNIAAIQRDQAQDMLKFLSTKFTNVELYEWMIGELAEVYAFLLRTATTLARQAEGQLAFERQQAAAGLIKSDYWSDVLQQGYTSSSNTATTTDRRGITASARLLQDVVALDQYAFDSERRLLNLNQTFSLARLQPIEFEEFRKTGILSFSTTMRLFDEGFPGHYMRLIKKVRVSIAALIPPNQGIRATLSTSGLSRVVTSDPAFPTLVVRQEPQSVALTASMGSTGVFELDMQSDLLYPFDGMGVDTNWYLELPSAGNPFDYDALFDVLVSVEYTALNSIELRDRVVKQLPREVLSDRAFSVKRDLADVWYELANNQGGPADIAVAMSRADFPPQLADVSIRQIALIVRRKDGQRCDYKIKPSLRVSATQTIEAAEANAVNGIVSSRQSGAATWQTDLLAQSAYVGQSAVTWHFALADLSAQTDSVLQLLRDDEIDDVLVVFTFSGIKPAWN